MKKFFAFAILIVAIATSMVSCNNDNTDFVGLKAPIATEKAHTMPDMDINLMVAVTPAQKNYYNETYTVSIGDKTQNVKLSEMSAITTDQALSYSNVKNLSESFEAEVQFYIYPLGEIKAGETAKITSHQVTIKADHPTDKFDYINAVCFSSAKPLSGCLKSAKIFKGIYSDDESLNNFAQVLMDYDVYTYVKY